MPGLGRQYLYDLCDDKIDILTQLQDYGLEYLVYDILHKLTIKDICAAFQVCSGWNQWDNDYFWSKELQVALNHREELGIVISDSKSPKDGIKTLWRLQQSWRHGVNTKTCVELDSSVLSITCQGARVTCGLNSGEVYQADIKTGTENKRKEMHEKGVRVVRYDPETKLMFTGSYDGCVKVWEGNWNLVKTLVMVVAVTDIAFRDNHIYVTGDEGVITCFNSQNSCQKWTVTGGEMMNCVVVWDDALVTGSDAGNLDIRSLNTGDCLCILIGHTNPVRCIDVDRSRLVSGDYRGFVMIWDMEDIEQEMWSFKQKQKSNPPKLSTDGIYRMQGRRVVHTGSDTCEVLQHNSLLEHHGNVTGVFLTGPDVLVSASRDRTVNIHRFDHLSRPSSSKYERKSYL